jgi:predicted nuclease with RNAse H fold
MSLAGIDYGSKLSGNTAIAMETSDNTIEVFSSEKGKDADEWLISILLQENRPDHVYIDAPLSLPLAYSGKGTDYMYRLCDRITGAMSPMFLGGLTARAMQLKLSLSVYDILLIETYPSMTVKRLPHGSAYNKKKQPTPELWMDILTALNAEIIFHSSKRTHEFDALLALYAGKLAAKHQAIIVGDTQEGLICY